MITTGSVDLSQKTAFCEVHPVLGEARFEIDNCSNLGSISLDKLCDIEEGFKFREICKLLHFNICFLSHLLRID